MTARDKKEARIVPDKLVVDTLKQLCVGSAKGRQGPFAVGVAPFSLVQDSAASAGDNKLCLGHSRIFDPNAFRFAIEDPDEFGDGPPKLVLIAKFICCSACQCCHVSVVSSNPSMSFVHLFGQVPIVEGFRTDLDEFGENGIAQRGCRTDSAEF